MTARTLRLGPESLSSSMVSRSVSTQRLFDRFYDFRAWVPPPRCQRAAIDLMNDARTVCSHTAQAVDKTQDTAAVVKLVDQL